MSKNIIESASKIVEKNSMNGGEFIGQMCVISLIDEAGFPTASVVTPSKSEGISWITFGTTLDSNKAIRAKINNKASVAFVDGEYCINLVGTIEVITDADVKKDMWYDGLGYHMTGSDDPNYCVLKFTTQRYKLFLDGEEVEGVL